MILLATRMFLLVLLGLVAGPGAERPDGAQLFQASCYSCHHAGSGYAAPNLDQLHQMSRDSILLALESGRMKAQGAQLTSEERTALAEFLGTPENTQTPSGPRLSPCAAKSFSTVGDPSWNGWGVDLTNSRFQPSASAGLGRAEVPRLKLKWAFGFPNASATYGQPTVAGGRLFAGSEDGTVYSLDAHTGCTYWSYKAETTVKTAVSVDSSGRAVFFGDTNGNVYATLAESG